MYDIKYFKRLMRKAGEEVIIKNKVIVD